MNRLKKYLKEKDNSLRKMPKATAKRSKEFLKQELRYLPWAALYCERNYSQTKESRKKHNIYKEVKKFRPLQVLKKAEQGEKIIFEDEMKFFKTVKNICETWDNFQDIVNNTYDLTLIQNNLTKIKKLMSKYGAVDFLDLQAQANKKFDVLESISIFKNKLQQARNTVNRVNKF